MTMKYKRNSPKLVMRITSVPHLLTCTKAPSPATAPFDSCHGRVSGINDQGRVAETEGTFKEESEVVTPI